MALFHAVATNQNRYLYIYYNCFVTKRLSRFNGTLFTLPRSARYRKNLEKKNMLTSKLRLRSIPPNYMISFNEITCNNVSIFVVF